MKILWFVAALALTGCVSENEVYRSNLTPPRLSPYVRSLPQAERDQIARLMAHRTSQPIICICEAKRPKYRGKLYVYTGYRGGHERGNFGSFTLNKIGGSWQITEGGTDLDPIMVCMTCNVR